MRSRTRDDNAAAVSLVGLALVVATGVISVWWWSHGAWLDFSSVNQVLPYITYTDPVAADHDPAAVSDVQSPAPEVATAPYCQPGTSPVFSNELDALHVRLGATMGAPTECAHANPANGDVLQQTTTGLAVYQNASGSVSFTNGWQHWRLRDGAMLEWEGSDTPPPTSPLTSPVHDSVAPQPETVSPQATQTSVDVLGEVRVANTGGTGVVLRSAPAQSARLPAGFMDGTPLRVLQRQGEWVEVRAMNGRQGWVPAEYLEPIQPPRA